jgi:hypothetical protein
MFARIAARSRALAPADAALTEARIDVGVEGALDSPWGRLCLRIEQRIRIELGAKSSLAPLCDAWSIEALQFVTQRAVALLRRVEVGKPPGWIRRRGCFG